MSVANIVETIQAKRDQAERDYRALVDALVAEEEIDPTKAARVLSAAQKSPVDLQGDVNRAKRVKELEAAAALRPEVERRRRELETARAAIVERQRTEILALRQRHDAEDADYHSVLGPIRLDELRIMEAGRELAQLRRSSESAPAAPSGTALPYAGSRYIDYRGSNVISNQPNG